MSTRKSFQWCWIVIIHPYNGRIVYGPSDSQGSFKGVHLLSRPGIYARYHSHLAPKQSTHYFINPLRSRKRYCCSYRSDGDDWFASPDVFRTDGDSRVRRTGIGHQGASTSSGPANAPPNALKVTCYFHRTRSSVLVAKTTTSGPFRRTSAAA